MATSYLPPSVKTKIYKTGQTRGANDDVIFQNRVARNSTVLIPFDEFEKCKKYPDKEGKYENGFIVLVKPEEFFKAGFTEVLKQHNLELGKNLLVFYETRKQWNSYPIRKGWQAATSRTNPLGGQFVARVPATTSKGESKIIEGFNTSSLKGAGIRVYEYSSSKNTKACRLQLELLFWSCKDIEELINEFNDKKAVYDYIDNLKKEAVRLNLFDKKQLIDARIMDNKGFTICPLCLKHISANGFCSKIQQAEGRDVPDLTNTEVSLFHIHELRTGEFNHRPYNLGWGHHHCNVVVKDTGIDATLQWMKKVLIRNGML